MPTVNIWRPTEENSYGHAAVKSDKYYISFWSFKVLVENLGKLVKCCENIKDVWMKCMELPDYLLKAADLVGSFDVLIGDPGGLVFCQHLDRENEYGRDPIEYDISATVSNDDINSIYEEFLGYNKINPEDVTLARGEELFQKYQEYKELSKANAQEMPEPELPQKLLTNTKYSFSAELVIHKISNTMKLFVEHRLKNVCVKSYDDGGQNVLIPRELSDQSMMAIEYVPFYHKKQSCVSFAFNIIQMAWMNQHSDRPIPITFSNRVLVLITDIPDSHSVEFPYEVPWFEEQVVCKYLVADTDKLVSTGRGLVLSFHQLKLPMFAYLLRNVFSILMCFWYQMEWYEIIFIFVLLEFVDFLIGLCDLFEFYSLREIMSIFWEIGATSNRLVHSFLDPYF